MSPDKSTVRTHAEQPPFIWDGGEMGKRIQAFDWSNTALGDIECWPPHLRSSVSLALHSALPMGIYWGQDLTILYNDAWSFIPGDKHPDILGKPAKEGWAEIWNVLKPQFEQVFTTGQAFRADDQLLGMKRFGYVEEAYFTYTFNPIFGESGQVEGIFNVGYDTTSRVLNERRMQSYKHLTQQISIAKTPQEVCTLATVVLEQASIDLPFTLIYLMDEQKQRYHLASATGLKDTSLAELLLLDIDETEKWPIAQLYQSEHTQRVTALPFSTRESLDHACQEALIAPFAPDVDGNVKGFLIAGTSPRLRVNEPYQTYIESLALHIGSAVQKTKSRIELSQSQERLSLALAATRDGLWDWDFKNDKVWWDVRYAEITGLTLPEDQRSLESVNPYIHPDDRPVIPATLKAHLERGERFEFEYRILHPSGDIKYVYAKGKAVLDEEGNVSRLVGTITDITERKQAETAYAESEERFRVLADAVPHMVWALKPDGSGRYINQASLKYLGITLEELQKTSWDPYIHPDDLEETRTAVSTAIQQQMPYSYEHRIRRHDGVYQWFLSKGAPSFYSNGKLYGYVGILVDITERKQAEETLLKYQKKLEQSNRELEQFAYVASHDLKAPLRKIAVFSNALEHKDGELLSEEGLDYLRRINKSTDKMQTLITDLLMLSSVTRQGRSFRPVNLKDVFTEVLADMEPYRREVGGNIIQTGTLCTVDGDESQLIQLFQNLLGNGLKFHRQNVPPIIKVECHMQPDNECRLTVQDNGIGLKMEYADRIFEIFERLHGQNTYEGTGIGLAIVKKIIDRHNGTIKVNSKLGEGTTFSIHLPIKQ